MKRRALLMLAGIAGTAGAVPTKTVTFSAPLPGITAAQQPDLAATVVSDQWVPFQILSPTAGEAPTTGKVQVRVARTKAGTLDFYWRVVLDTAPTKPAVTQLYVGGFPAVVYDANWRIDGLGTAAPGLILGAPGNKNTGPWVLVFDFPAPLKPGESSRFLLLRTKATKTKPATAYVGNKTGPGVSFATLAPAD